MWPITGIRQYGKKSGIDIESVYIMRPGPEPGIEIEVWIRDSRMRWYMLWKPRWMGNEEESELTTG